MVRRINYHFEIKELENITSNIVSFFDCLGNFDNYICLVCVENTSWQTTTGYRCADYAKNKWCENGGKGSAWKTHWNWKTDSFGLDARSVCCICGGNGKSGKSYYNLKIL